MIEKETIEVKTEKEVVRRAFCSFCNKEFDERTIMCGGWGTINIGFGFGSNFDDDNFQLEICDKCFLKEFGMRLEQQFKDKNMKWDSIQKSIKEGIENNNTK
jgi:hypothetical protein